MRRRKIGSLEVSVTGVGCNNFGRELDLEQTRRVVDAAIDHGVNFFDTADQYGRPFTTSESYLGEVLAGRRNEVVIATKFGRALDEERKGASPAYVRAATEASLRRLKTDRIDLMQLHAPDPDTPVEDTLGALADLVAEGKIVEIGSSNFDAAQTREADEASLSRGIPRFVSTQAEYSLLQRSAETSLLPECERRGIAFLPFFPLYNGLLSGRYRPGEPPPAASRIGSKDAAAQARILSPRNMAILADLTHFAEARGHTVLELAFAWLLGHDSVPSVIAGVRNAEQVAANVAASAWELTEEEMREVSALAPLAV